MRRAWPVLVLLAVACSTGSEATTTSRGSTLSGELLVSAAASLSEVFGAVAAEFEVLHPEVDVALNFGSSSGLRSQIIEGAPVDLFASANTANMDAVAAEVEHGPAVFAHNRLVIAVPEGNPARVEGLGDFARSEILIGLCAEAVPCGGYARAALAKAGMDPSVDSAEVDVRALVAKIAAGELDAGIAYQTDIRAGVQAVELPDEHNVVVEYPVAVLAGAQNPTAARAFVEFLVGHRGQAILAEYGFGSP